MLTIISYYRLNQIDVDFISLLIVWCRFWNHLNLPIKSNCLSAICWYPPLTFSKDYSSYLFNHSINDLLKLWYSFSIF